MTTNQTRSVLVTGAAGGIGKALVERLAAKGDFVIAVARSRAQLTELESETVRTVAMDVGDTESVTAGWAEVAAALAGRPLNAVVHCAAVAPNGTIEFTPVEQFGQTININTLGALRIFQGAMPHLRASKGRFIFVSSLWGRVAGPLVGNYASSKHAIEAMADSARRETAGSGVDITVVEPGVVLTKMLTNQGASVQKQIDELSSAERGYYIGLYQSYKKLCEGSVKSAITAEACAAAIENVLNVAKPKTRYLIGKDAKIVGRLGILPDRWLDALFGKMVKA
jgi:NAD(P)-dependent dehydrogenase (short-subunit alcohol dehydrogenase family)